MSRHRSATEQRQVPHIRCRDNSLIAIFSEFDCLCGENHIGIESGVGR
jgi:hypothetical protein